MKGKLRLTWWWFSRWCAAQVLSMSPPEGKALSDAAMFGYWYSVSINRKGGDDKCTVRHRRGRFRDAGCVWRQRTEEKMCCRVWAEMKLLASMRGRVGVGVGCLRHQATLDLTQLPSLSSFAFGNTRRWARVMRCNWVPLHDAGGQTILLDSPERPELPSPFGLMSRLLLSSPKIPSPDLASLTVRCQSRDHVRRWCWGQEGPQTTQIDARFT